MWGAFAAKSNNKENIAGWQTFCSDLSAQLKAREMDPSKARLTATKGS